MKKFGYSLIFLSLMMVSISLDAASSIQQAKILLNQGRFDESIDLLKKTVEKDGETEEILYLLGINYFQTRKLFYAEKSLTEALNKNANNTNTISLLYMVQDRLHKYPESIETLNNLFRIKKNNAFVYYQIGDQYLKLKTDNPDKEIYKTEALKNFEKSLETDKNMWQSAMKIAEIYFMEKDYLKALPYFDIILKIKPNNETAKSAREIAGLTGYQNIADAFFKEKKYNEAAKFYQEALRYSPQNYELSVKSANCYYLIHEYKQALVFLDKALKLKPKPTEAYYLQGLVLYNVEEYAKAEELFKTCAIENPKDAQPYYYLARIKEKSKENTEAIKYYKEAIKRNEKKGEFHKNLGLIYLKEQEFQKAVDELDTAENLDKTYDLKKYIQLAKTLNYVSLGHKEFEKKNYKKALSYYEDAEDLMPLSQIYLSLGNTLIKLNEYGDAVEKLLKAKELDKEIIEIYESLALAYRKLNKFSDADKIYDDLKKITKNNPEIFYKSGKSYEEQGRYDTAISMYKSALQINLNYTNAKEGIASAYYKMGLELYNNNKYQEANDNFKLGLPYSRGNKLFTIALENCDLQLKVTAVNSLIETADQLFTRGKYKEASVIYKRIGGLKPGLYEIKIRESQCYYKMNDYDAVEMILKDLITDFPDKPQAFIDMAEFYIERGKLQKADEMLKIAEKKDPRYYKLFYAKGYLYESKNDLQEAVKNYNSSLQLNPEFYDVHINLGNVYYKTMKYSKAEEEYRIVLRKNPNDITALYNLGVIFMKTGVYNQALQQFIRLEPYLFNYAPYYYHLGKTYYYLNNYQPALKNIKKAVDMELDILYVWGLGNTYMKLIDDPRYSRESMKARALEVLKLCVENTENNKISLMARRAILQVNPGEKLLYAYRLPIDSHFTPIITGNFSYVYSDKRESLLKIEKESENIIWELKEPAPPSCQFVLGKYLFCGLENGSIIAIDKEDGTIKWKFPEYMAYLKPIKDSILAINGDNNKIYFLDEGKAKWEKKIKKDNKHSILTEKTNIIYYNNSLITKLNYKNGEQEWQYDLENEKGKIVSAAAGENYVFINIKHNKENSFLTLNKDNGKKLWVQPIPDELQSPPILYTDKIICILKGGRVYTFYKDGKKEWDKKFNENIISSLVRGNKLYVSVESDQIFGLQINNGQVVWNYKMQQTDKDQIFMIYYKQ